MLNCKTGSLPLKYLGFPISDKKLPVKVFDSVVNKLKSKLQPWKGKHLSYGGRLILTNSSLSSIPIYTMGLYLLPEGIHHQMDTVRSRFFWRGDPDKFKYHLVNWDNSCLPKDFGGLGILNTRVLNESLLIKWIWRLYNKEPDDQCCQLLQAKYLRDKPFSLCKRQTRSQFWRGLLQVRDKFKWGATFSLGNGKSILFWEEVWIGDTPLRLEFPRLYDYCYNKTSLVSDCWVEGDWRIDFRRSLDQSDLTQWNHLLRVLAQTSISDTEDKVRWALEKKGGFLHSIHVSFSFRQGGSEWPNAATLEE